VPQTFETTMRARSLSSSAVAENAALTRTARTRRVAQRVLRFIIQAIVFTALVSLFFFRVPQVEGRSMQPDIESGNHVLINTLAYGVALGPWVLVSNPVQRGDIVAFERGQGDDRKLFLKRVIALPGEDVAVKDGIVSVNGLARTETSALLDRSNMRVVTVPASSVFVLGDNRGESDDSRSFGPIPESSIVGKALFVIWPLGHVKRVL
jgi:signal peptidase I